MLIQNSGLVLFSPFVHELFVRLGLLVAGSNERFIDQAALSRGALLLEFLASGLDGPPEFHTALSLLLCGAAPSSVVSESKALACTDAEACDELLGAVIAQWSVLRETSITDLRATFIQRNGKLTFDENHWTLEVERKSLDVLVDQVPWSFGSIQFPWMREPLHVIW